MNSQLVKPDQDFDACQIRGETIALWVPILFALIGIVNSIIISHLLLNSSFKSDSIFTGYSSIETKNKQKTEESTAGEVKKIEPDFNYIKDESKSLETGIKSRIDKAFFDKKNEDKVQKATKNNIHIGIIDKDNLNVLTGVDNSATDYSASPLNNISTITKLTDGKAKAISDGITENTQLVSPKKKPSQIEDCLSPLSFTFSNGRISPNNQDLSLQIQTLTLWIKKHSHLKIFIEGHSDSKGSEESNLLLSYRRANFIKNLLIKSGIPKKQLITRALGEQEPLQDQPTQSRKNRRVSVRVKDSENCIDSMINGDSN